MPARFVTTSFVTKRAGTAACFVTLVPVVTKRAATGTQVYLRTAVHRRGQRPPKFWVLIKLQALVYDILPSTTAVFSYAIGSRKLSANERFFVGAQTVVCYKQLK